MRDSGGTPARVVIAGAGFAGLWAARRLRGKGLRTILLDRENYHTFLPLLYQVAAAELGPTEIAYPVRSILRGAPDVQFRMGNVLSVDPERRELVTDRERIGYDHLVLAMGATTHYFGVEGAEEHAFPLRSMAEAIPLRHHLLSCFERAAHETDETLRRRLLTFVIVGGGPTGVEFSGALAELMHGPLRKDYPMIDPDEVRIVLVEALERILLGMPGDLSAYARSRLADREVDVRENTFVSRVTPFGVRVEANDEAEEIAAETVVWTGGVRGAPGPADWGFPMGKQGRVLVGSTLQVQGRDDVWVAGDLAWLEQDGAPLPGVAAAAIQGGKHVADNILRVEAGEEPEPFRFEDPGMLAVIGRNAAVGDVRGRTFQGAPAWILWLAIHIVKLIGFRNRLLVLVNWAWNYVFMDRTVRLILPYVRSEPFGRDTGAASGREAGALPGADTGTGPHPEGTATDPVGPDSQPDVQR
jgi:NADH:ubiquinone reductase (H+-translocating)